MNVYNTLFDWQKLFVDNAPRQYFIDKFGLERSQAALGENFNNPVIGNNTCEKIGFFLRMGTGKTKITVAKAETKDADCIFVTSLRTKVIAGEEKGEFGDELKRAGYKVFYAHNAIDEDGELTILSLNSKKAMKEFEQAVAAKERIAYVFNHDHITTKKGYAKLLMLAVAYDRIVWIVDEAHKISNAKAELSKMVYDMLYAWSTPNVKVRLRELKRAKKEAIERGDKKMLRDLELQESLSRENIFRKKLVGFYLATGTPNSSGYISFYWLLTLLGHQWKYTGYREVDGVVEAKQFVDYNAFFEEFCVEDTWVKKFNPYARAIKGYTRTEKLLDIVQQYAFFAKTENYFEGMPKRLVEVAWLNKDISYKQLTNPKKENPHYRVLGGYICDTPALLGLRARQLASGFMGNAEHADYFHANKTVLLQNVLEDSPGNYIVFYNYTPELQLILSAAVDAGYNVDIYNGIEKSLDNYRRTKGDDNERNILIANIDSGSAALNLQKYRHVIFFSLPDMFRDYDQGIGRVERIGQIAKEVSVLVFVTKGTIEEKIWKKIQKGENYTDAMYARDIIWREL